MLILTRTVRFAINGAGVGPGRPAVNGFAGRPSVSGFGRHYELDVSCAGEPDPVTGYAVDIAVIDRAVRTAVVPIVERACAGGAPTPIELLPDVLRAADEALGGAVSAVRWRLTPYHSIAMEKRAMNKALIRQQFEFAAAHRLHAPGLSDEENRRVFGKCNNPSGHGHNYRIEPIVAAPIAPSGRPRITLNDIEHIVHDTIIRRFDHKHLNIDTAEFAELNPSVENIARVSFDLLRPEVEAAGGELRAVTVWETEKTSCTYPA